MSSPVTMAGLPDLSGTLGRLTGRRRARAAERRLRQDVFRAPPRYTISQWADRYAMLPAGSAEEGRWRTSRAPYQRGIMDAISDPNVQEVTWVASSQIGKSAIILNVIGSFVDQDPCSILLVEPTLDFVREFSKDRVEPMLRNTPALRKKVRKASGRRESSNTMLRKEFVGGFLAMVGANSATGLASRPIRVALFDETDKYPPSAGRMGDPIKLGISRTRTFRHRKKIVKTSTPGLKGYSRIETSYESSDMRRYYVPCPDCKHMQHLRWAQVVFDDAAYACEGCGVLIPESAKPWMLEHGEWRAEHPERTHVGFHLNSLYSPWSTWQEIIDDFLASKGNRDTMQVFTNEQLAETFEEDGEVLDASALGARRETYVAEVPLAVGILTASIDVQKSWIEILIKGWGAGQESWLIHHARLYGDPQRNEVWERADTYLVREWKHESGATLRVRCACVDSGDQTQAVYKFVRPRQRRMVFATKGMSVRAKPIVNRPGRSNKYGVKVIPIGTDTAKDVIFPRLKIKESGTAGYMHFPQVQPDGADDEYLAQFAGEKVMGRRVKGVLIREYIKVRDRNEAIDLEVLCLAALHMLGAGVYDQLGLWAAKVLENRQTPTESGEKGPESVVLAPNRPVIPRPRGGYVNSWRNR